MTAKILLFCLSGSFMIFSLSLESSAFMGAKFEPPDDKIYHCAQAEVRPASVSSYKVDWDGIEKYVSAVGHRPRMIMHYITLDTFGFNLLKDSIIEIYRQPHNYIAQIGLTFYGHPQNKNVPHSKDITDKIAIGTFDGNIRELARLLAKMKAPVFLRPGFEFGGNGYGQYASKKYWIGAWKRVYDIFKKEDAENVAFVWNTLDARDFINYYPGDKYVDWWAINVFNNDSDKDEFVNAFIKEAAKHNKPVMIAESTPRHIGSINGAVSWHAWYGPYFRLLSQYKHVKAFCYINASWKNFWDKTFRYDSRIQIDRYVSENYRKALADPKFIHSDMLKQK
jgi:hypothetical protein